MDIKALQAAAEKLDASAKKINHLNPKQLRVARLITEEHVMDEIASLLKTSRLIVRRHVHKIHGILDTKDLTQLAIVIYWKELMEDDDPGTPNRPLCELLSPKELEVAYLILDESSNREIGVRLAIALDTVENYIQHIFNKLGMSSRIEVAHYVVREIFFATHTIYSPVPQ